MTTNTPRVAIRPNAFGFKGFPSEMFLLTVAVRILSVPSLSIVTKGSTLDDFKKPSRVP